MVKKKSSPKSKTTPSKSSKKAALVEANHCGKCFIALGAVILVLLGMIFCLSKNQKSNLENQEAIAFEGVVSRMISEEYFIEGERAAIVTGLGISDDNDLYADFIITKYEGHIPISNQPARIHFQCHEADDVWKFKDNCAHALWVGDIAETSEEYRSAYRTYIEKIEASVEKYNSTDNESEREKILEEQKLIEDEFTEAILKYSPDYQKNALENQK